MLTHALLFFPEEHPGLCAEECAELNAELMAELSSIDPANVEARSTATKAFHAIRANMAAAEKEAV